MTTTFKAGKAIYTTENLSLVDQINAKFISAIMEKTRITTGAPWEDIAGYSRAIRVGNVIEISGTTAL